MVPLIILGWLDGLNPFKQVSNDIGMLMMAFKIVIILFLIQFLKERITNSMLMSLFFIACGWVLFFSPYNLIFQLFMVGVLALSFGFTQIMFDLSITKPWAKAPEGGGEQNQDFRRLY